jgi:hypothetical protein
VKRRMISQHAIGAPAAWLSGRRMDATRMVCRRIAAITGQGWLKITGDVDRIGEFCPGVADRTILRGRRWHWRRDSRRMPGVRLWQPPGAADEDRWHLSPHSGARTDATAVSGPARTGPLSSWTTLDAQCSPGATVIAPAPAESVLASRSTLLSSVFLGSKKRRDGAGNQRDRLTESANGKMNGR